MSNQQMYEEMEDIINNFDNISKDEILSKLKIFLRNPCPNCKVRCDSVTKSGKELNPRATFGAEKIMYELCSNCDYRYSYHF